MAQTLKALSALLSYPTSDLVEALPEINAAIDGESLLANDHRQALAAFVAEVASNDLFDLQERYVELFDRGRALSLHLFEHVHGEGRDRGQAMVDLLALYGKHGLAIGAAELPDYLPLFLEFASTRPLAEARELLGQPAHVIAAIGERLKKRRSGYASVFDALGALAASRATEAEVASLDREPDDDPADLAALDAAWEEAPVTFGPEAAPGCRDDLIARLRASKRRVPRQTN